jgi:DNA-binding CsgD family transcriptional regulator
MARLQRKVMEARLRAIPILLDAGMSKEQVATAFGLQIGHYLRQLGLLRKHTDVRAPDERSSEMADLYRGGSTLEDIGQKFELSRERVRQILSKSGINKNDAGWKATRAAARQASLKDKWNSSLESKNKRCLNYYGCPYEVLRQANGDDNISRTGSPAQCYLRQRESSHKRGIAWEITFPEWWRVWQESGKWPERGRGRDKYCMSRIGDRGPYRADNVAIVTNAQNSSDSYITKPAARRFNLKSHTELSERQAQIRKLTDAGLRPVEIAAALGIKPSTVRLHICAINQKLGVYEEKYAA